MKILTEPNVETGDSVIPLKFIISDLLILTIFNADFFIRFGSEPESRRKVVEPCRFAELKLTKGTFPEVNLTSLVLYLKEFPDLLFWWNALDDPVLVVRSAARGQ